MPRGGKWEVGSWLLDLPGPDHRTHAQAGRGALLGLILGEGAEAIHFRTVATKRRTSQGGARHLKPKPEHDSPWASRLCLGPGPASV